LGKGGTKGQVPCPKGKRKTGRQLTAIYLFFFFLFCISTKGLVNQAGTINLSPCPSRILFQFNVRGMLLFVTREAVLINGLPIVNLIKRLFENYYGAKIIDCFIHK
jgi:hypothetical protein